MEEKNSVAKTIDGINKMIVKIMNKGGTIGDFEALLEEMEETKRVMDEKLEKLQDKADDKGLSEKQQEQYNKLDEEISKLEDMMQTAESAKDALTEIQDKLYELFDIEA
jgi:hypothetical protein